MGILYIVSTPIGNLEDITVRAIKTLFSVDYIASEDTRRTGQLLKSYELRISNQELSIKGIDINKKPKLISYYDEIEFKRIPELIDLLTQNKNIAIVSDSGTPLISDPGYKFVQECIKKEIKIISIPGPSSIITALTSSGLPTNQFLFLSYLPPSRVKRLKLLSQIRAALANPQGQPLKWVYPTVIFFETPHRLKESLEDLKSVFGDINIVIARELTKIHEQVWRGKISQAVNNFYKPMGEIVILFSI